MTFIGVYRLRNAPIVEALLRSEPLTATWDIRLWALDEVHPSLEGSTWGSGPGGKFELINKLVNSHAVNGPVVVSDDDVLFARGSVGEAVALGQRAGFDLYQPAHAWSSLVSYRFTRRRVRLRARETAFVEIGPVFVVSARLCAHFFPLRDPVGMGWGLEFGWSRLRTGGYRLGIVDDVALVHLEPPNAGYSTADEGARYGARMAAAGFHSMRDIQRTLRKWPRWRRDPPWTRDLVVDGTQVERW